MTDPTAGESRRLRLRDNQLFLAHSIIIGILAGLAAVLFALAIDGADDALFGPAPSSLRRFLVPVLVRGGTGSFSRPCSPAYAGAEYLRRRPHSTFTKASFRGAFQLASS